MKLYLGGTFDLLHPGHLNLFKKASALGEVIVSLNTDEFSESYKRKPIMNLIDRLEMVKACRYVDRVVINTGGRDSKPAILSSGATHIVHGDDWTGEALMKQMSLTPEFMKENNLEMLYLPYTKGISTSDIIKAVYESYSNLPPSRQ